MNSKKEKVLKTISDLEPFLKILLDELIASNEFIGQSLLLAEKANDFSYLKSLIRMRVRIVVSVLESACYKFRHIAREICELKKITIPPKYSELFDKKKKSELKEIIKLSLKFFAYAFTGDDNIDSSSIEWQKVCDLIEKRHHLTHPSSIADFEVSENDLNIANVSTIWFVNQLKFISKKEEIKITMKHSDDEIKNIINRFKEKYQGII